MKLCPFKRKRKFIQKFHVGSYKWHWKKFIILKQVKLVQRWCKNLNLHTGCESKKGTKNAPQKWEICFRSWGFKLKLHLSYWLTEVRSFDVMISLYLLVCQPTLQRKALMALSLTRSKAADLTDMTITMGCQEPSLVAAADILVLSENWLIKDQNKSLLPTSRLVN